jgi:hypothetical protein
MTAEDEDNTVQIYNRVNRLKMKAGGAIGAGPGRFDPSMVDRGQSVIRHMAGQYEDEIQKSMDVLAALWAETRAQPAGERKENAQKISNLANQIKDLAATFDIDLMEYFGQSLRDYVLNIDLSQDAHVIIVQAHVDVMQVAHKNNLKSQDHPLGEELKKTVAAAIAKYS